MKKLLFKSTVLLTIIFCLYIPPNLAFTQNQGESIQTDIKAIGLKKAKKYFEKGVRFIDLRSHSVYQNAHIAGALNISLEDFENDLMRILSQKDRVWGDCPCAEKEPHDPREICILYGYGQDIEAVSSVSDRLSQEGFNKIIILKADFSEWSAVGYPIMMD